ncbi:hypothetical protein JDV02_010079 [Purpureocillium takamizusanense]|uniref:Cenp-O kinetochore centromere component n=1 Tax=Purpureocillium takamizusanense TaxID=2060973 RepID=A0A9Q8QRG2_9HYPO|nr:uncharacterized protein JDV02_010079 [Purpureocillium takamizusanense]UNI24323.1 hypothetical protein JDV02_010079 [Purpureocillium takamizusanense]
MAAVTKEATSARKLDEELEQLKAEAEKLRSMLKIQCSTILSSKSMQSMIKASESASSSLRRRVKNSSSAAKLKKCSAEQHAYVQQCVYRISAPVTAFKVHDPDPNAVDGGHVLGLRFEIMSRGQFLRPYYVMLNRPFAGSKYLRVHRHTLPPAVPLAGLAAQHLPTPKSADDRNGGESARGQDLDRFVRTLRREIVRYHNRLGVSADLRRRLGLHDASRSTSLPENSIVEVGIADIEAKQIKVTWADERSGRLTMDDDGNVQKLVVFGSRGRDWETTKELFGRYERMEDIAQRLEQHGAAG